MLTAQEAQNLLDFRRYYNCSSEKTTWQTAKARLLFARWLYLTRRINDDN